MHGFSKEGKKKIIALLVLTLVLGACLLIYARVVGPMTELLRDVNRLSQWVEDQGWTSKLIYVALVWLQVVIAFIPGEPLELAAGFVFGAVEGTLLCLLGVFLGSVTVFLLVRTFGMKLVELFFSREKIQSLKILHNPKRLLTITAVLLILPGTPKDLLTYCAGLLPMQTTTWLLLCSVTRIPSVLTSTLCGQYVAEGNYSMAVIVFAITAFLCGIGLWFYAKQQEKKQI